MRQIGFHISPGTENQLAVTPTLISTSQVFFIHTGRKEELWL